MTAAADNIPVIEVTDLVREFHGRRVLNGLSFKIIDRKSVV